MGVRFSVIFYFSLLGLKCSCVGGSHVLFADVLGTVGSTVVLLAVWFYNLIWE